jgi:hypothetical protein
MQDVIQIARYMDEGGNIVMIEFKILQFEKVFNILQISGNEIIHSDYLKSFFDEAVT